MKICIIKLSALGDVIHTMVVLQYIKEKMPNSQIDWVVEEGFKHILDNNPYIDNILSVNLKSIKLNKLKIFSQIKLVKKYSKNNYDIVIDAQGLLKSSIVAKLIGAKSIVGFCKNSIRETLASKIYDKTVSIGYDENVIDRNVKLFNEALGLSIIKENILIKESFLYSKDKSQKKVDVVFVVGASKENKIYPKENFLELANELSEFNIEVIWASQSEKDVATYLSKNAQNVTVCEKMSLDSLKNKIQNSSLVIGGDTGPTHMAWGLNIASITIFGNTPEYRNTYITDINKVVKSDSEVDPLRLDKNDFSIRDIKAREIAELAKKLLN